MADRSPPVVSSFIGPLSGAASASAAGPTVARLPIGVLRMSELRRCLIRALRQRGGAELPRDVANWYDEATVAARIRLLTRLLQPLGPMAAMVLGGGVFARFAVRHPGRELLVDEADTRRIGAEHVFHLVVYLQQSDLHLAETVAGLLAQDLRSTSLLSAALIEQVNRHLRELWQQGGGARLGAA